MKSLLATTMVLASFGWQSSAEQPDPSKANPVERREVITQPTAKTTDVSKSSTSSTDTPRTTKLAPVKTSSNDEKQQPEKSTTTKTAPLKTATPKTAQPKAVTAKTTDAPAVKLTPSHSAPAVAKNPTKIEMQKLPVSKTPLAKAPVAHTAVGVQQPTKPAALTQVPIKNTHTVQAPVVKLPLAHQPPPLVFGQPPTPAQIHQVQLHNQLVMQQNPLVRTFVDRHVQLYRTNYNAQILERQERYLAPAFLPPLRVQYRPWVNIGFYAYLWPVRPVVEFYGYFSNPCVSFFYNEYDAEFYRPYYGQYAERFPDLNRGYNHVGIYFPTEEFMTLNVSLSGMPIEYQVNYRRSMAYLSDRLIERARGPIGRHEVVINHYQMLPNNRAVLVEGFVDSGHVQVPFRALIDLNNADGSRLFALGNWRQGQVPTLPQSYELNELNDQLVDYGGTLEAPPAI